MSKQSVLSANETASNEPEGVLSLTEEPTAALKAFVEKKCDLLSPSAPSPVAAL